MSVVLLVRHGQASFGAVDYDQLSDLGARQSETLGRALQAKGIRPAKVRTGSMRRHLQTAEATIKAAGWTTACITSTSWNEFDHQDVLCALGAPATNDPERFQSLLERSTSRWAAGDHDADYSETFGAFTARVHEGLAHLATDLPSGDTAVVFTSGGAISWITASLLGGGYPQWRTLNRVAINTGVTKLIIGRTGPSVVSFNDHSHLSAGQVTYL